jgi:predicted nuclease with RNAse H fold
MRYCGVVPARGLLQLVLLEEVRTPEPPIRLVAAFFEPGTTAQVAAELLALPEAVVAIGAPLDGPGDRACDEMLRGRGLSPAAQDPEASRLAGELSSMGVFQPGEDGEEGPVPEGAYRVAPVFETNPNAVFCALQGRRLPAKRHPYGIQLRISLLVEAQVLDDGGDLWHRRIEEIDAAGAALCAHRYAVGHAAWLGRPGDGVVVLPGTAIPGRFTTDGVLPLVERLELPPERP